MNSAAPPCTPAAATPTDPAVKAAILGEALPYLRRYSGQTVLVKYGGHAMTAPGADGGADDPFTRDIVLLQQVGINPIIVHGGGPQISQMLQRLAIKSSFVDGLRVTDRETMEVVEMVLAGTINKQLVAEINAAGGCAVGLTGRTAASFAPARRCATGSRTGCGSRRSGSCRRAGAGRRPRAGDLPPIGHHPGHRPDRLRHRRRDLQHQLHRVLRLLRSKS